MMKISAILNTESRDSESTAAALDADNIELDGLRVETKKEKNKVITIIESNSLKTLIHTLDDLICCQMVAEKTLE